MAIFFYKKATNICKKATQYDFPLRCNCLRDFQITQPVKRVCTVSFERKYKCKYFYKNKCKYKYGLSWGVLLGSWSPYFFPIPPCVVWLSLELTDFSLSNWPQSQNLEKSTIQKYENIHLAIWTNVFLIWTNTYMYFDCPPSWPTFHCLIDHVAKFRDKYD